MAACLDVGVTTDKAGEQYWTDFWQERRLPPAIEIRGSGPRAWFYQEFHHLWEDRLPRKNNPAIRLLEIGCAQSRWMPYFAREWGYTVAGLDYSELGCRQSRQLLAREGIAGEVYHQDLFHPAPGQSSSFDLIFSNGVVEHFQDTAAVLKQLAIYLKPEGLMITLIPNLTGWLGNLQQQLGPEVMAVHQPLTLEGLAQAHAAAGLLPSCCAYLAFLHFSVVHPGARWRDWRRFCLVKGLKSATAMARFFHKLFPLISANRHTAGYIACVAGKPPGGESHLEFPCERIAGHCGSRPDDRVI
jgi:2-polyprenyl-3-methyl-5-hydroxy-6-metoxy-1,4-benzoquinol methylase